MRPIVLAVLLATASLAGCLQQGEPVNPIEPASQSDASAQPRNAGQSSTNESTTADRANGNESTPGTTSDANDTADANETSQGDQDASDQPPAPPAEPMPTPEAYALNATVELGYQAALGGPGAPPDTPASPPAGPPNRTDEAHCPTANLTVPGGASRLDVDVENQTLDPDEPGVGAYRLLLTAPDGTVYEVSWMDTRGPDGGEMRFTQNSPQTGAWTLEVDAEGPAVQQAWTVRALVEGKTIEPPETLQVTAAC